MGGGDVLNGILEQKTTVNIFFFVLLLSNKKFFFGFVLFFFKNTRSEPGWAMSFLCGSRTPHALLPHGHAAA